MSRRSFNRARAKGRCESGPFLALPKAVLESENFIRCPPAAKALMLDLGNQYRGNNNGDLSATWEQMKPRGWRSKATLNQAIKALLHYCLIEKTRQGGKHVPSLYALTWKEIDECGGKLDVPATRVASGLWKKPAPPLARSKKKILAPESVPMCPRIRANQAANEPELVQQVGQSGHLAVAK